MDANGANNSSFSRQMQLRSQGPVDLLDTTQLNPPGSYVRSYDYQQRCNVNAGYNTVSLKIRERRRELITAIAAILGGDSRYWFAARLRPDGLPVRPLDWSTTLLQYLCKVADSLPTHVRNTAVDQRLWSAHQQMLADASNPPGSDSSGNSSKTRRPDDSSGASNEHGEIQQLRAQILHQLNQIQALQEENFDLEFHKQSGYGTAKDLQDELKTMAWELSECKRELEALREQTAWTERALAMSNQVQTVLTQHQRARGFY